MYTIGVLEDEMPNFTQLQECILRYGKENQLEFDLQLFTDGQQFLETDFTKFDMIFLDIQVPGASGMEVAERIRERDKDVVIFFCTRLSRYAIFGYQVEALDYIIKPIRYSSMKLRLDKALRHVRENQQKDTIVLHTNRSTVRICISDIYYVEARQHKTVYNTAHGVFEVWAPFRSAKAELEPHQFAQCHGSYLCNLRWVTGLDGDEVLIHDTVRLKISRNLKKPFTDALTSFWAETEV